MRSIITLLILLSVASPSFGKETEGLPYFITLYGARGSGKTLLTVRTRQEFSFPTISLASLLTGLFLEETPLTKKARECERTGSNFPEEIYLSLLNERLKQPDCAQGVLFEDFPNTVEQAESLHTQLGKEFNFLAIVINTPDEWLIQRVEQRLVCRMCGKVYDESFPPNHKGLCDICSGPLEQRLDDSPDLIRSRLEAYKTKVSPLLDFYKEKQTLITISGEQNLEDVYQEIISSVESQTGLIGQKLRYPKKNRLFLQENT